MAIYKCNNPECDLFGKEDQVNTHIKYICGERKDISSICPQCKQEREMKNQGLCTNMHGGMNLCNK